MAGGAANVACNLAQLGLHVHLIGVCGNDKAAKDLETEISGYPAIEFDPVLAVLLLQMCPVMQSPPPEAPLMFAMMLLAVIESAGLMKRVEW